MPAQQQDETLLLVGPSSGFWKDTQLGRLSAERAYRDLCETYELTLTAAWRGATKAADGACQELRTALDQAAAKPAAEQAAAVSNAHRAYRDALEAAWKGWEQEARTCYAKARTQFVELLEGFKRSLQGALSTYVDAIRNALAGALPLSAEGVQRLGHELSCVGYLVSTQTAHLSALISSVPVDDKR